jgi:cytochrome b561
MKIIYTPDDYDEHMVLKPSVGMIVTFFIGIRHFALILLPALMSFKSRGGGPDLSFMEHLVSPGLLLGDLLILPLLLAWAKRTPNSSKTWQKIWAKGRTLLLLAFIIQSAVFTYLSVIPAIYSFSSSNRITLFPFYYLFLTLIFIYYIWASQRIKDVFSEWPQPNK